jgi:nucleotide-binding universal stress UspA family protein
MILLGYDGSEDARAAIDHAGRLLSSQTATVLTVWEPFTEVVNRTLFGGGMTVGMVDTEAIDAANRDGAQARAEEGAELARAAGLDAQARSCVKVTTFADAITAVADEVGATAIVVGSRGLSGIKLLFVGSVSHALIQHADRTVIVVPSARIALARAHHRTAEVAELTSAPAWS